MAPVAPTSATGTLTRRRPCQSWADAAAGATIVSMPAVPARRAPAAVQPRAITAAGGRRRAAATSARATASAGHGAGAAARDGSDLVVQWTRTTSSWTFRIPASDLYHCQGWQHLAVHKESQAYSTMHSKRKSR